MSVMPPFPPRIRKLVSPEDWACQSTNTTSAKAVEFFPQRGVEHTAKGRFKVVRVLLGERNAPHYRIKHEVDGHERMVGESELGPR